MKKTSPVYVIGFMVVICALCGAAISFVQFSMKPTLDANARLVRNRTIARAFGITVPQQTAGAYDSALALRIDTTTVADGGRRWQLFTRKEAPHDIGFIFNGMAFWDMISGIIVLSKDLATIRSLEIIEQKETPGLGARIEEPQFKKLFEGFPVDWSQPADKRVVFGEPAGPDGTHRIDAITGATQTSMALERILNSELAAFRRIYDHHDREAAPQPTGRK
ncbi:MAG: FMN-binding protein [Chitinispirillaceae bacterium]|nr:FMN-binding protein [Chitinispirillaceae bacterium]